MKHFLLLLLTITTLGVSAQTINGRYALKNKLTGLYARIKDANKSDGTALVAYPPVEWKCVTWEFEHQAKNAYQLRNLFTSKTVVPTEANTLEQKPIAKTPKAVQGYDFIDAGAGYYKIRVSGTELFLTMSEDTKTNDPIQLKAANGTEGQLWSLVAQDPAI